MIITNRERMPDLLFQALAENREPVEGEIHVTQLIGPPLLDQLRRKHWDDLVQDASERLYALMGQGMHAAIANDGRLQYAKAVVEQLVNNVLNMDLDEVLCVLNDLLQKLKDGTQEGIESALRVPINKKWTLVGTDDHFNEDECKIMDWKYTSVWSIVYADHDWEDQLNCYAWMRRQLGYDVKHIEVWALIRDWNKYEAKYGGGENYPPIPFVRVPLNLWTLEKQERYIKSRIRKFNGKAPECSAKEKWQTPDTFKVMKKGVKKAKVASWIVKGKREKLMSIEEAKAAAQAKNIVVDGTKYYIEAIKGECKRCDLYCVVNKQCPYFDVEENNGD
jgi:hypothetical protein